MIGPTHSVKNLPNQDAHLAFADDHLGLAILAVADGHGSELCSHSEIGSKLAVSVAVDKLRDVTSHLVDRFNFVESPAKDIRFASALASLSKDLPEDLVQAWRARVDEYRTEFGVQSRDGYLAFGTTLLAVAITSHFAIALQIGDGDILLVDSSNEVSMPLRSDEPKVGDETKSLCLERAENYFRFEFFRFSTKPVQPKAWFLATDGFSNSFKDNVSFQKAIKDFGELLETEEGRSTIDSELEEWLREYAAFSGDDVTLGMLFDQSQCRS